MKIGGYSFPLYRLDKMLQATKKIYDQYRNGEIDRNDIAQILGHESSKSGAVAQKIADMRSYGLLDGSRDKFTVSRLGKDATYGTSEEKNTAIQKAVLNIPLWAKLFEDFGPRPQEQNFWITLRKITGAESPDAQKNANLVRNSYIEDVSLFNPVSEPVQSPFAEAESGDEAADREWSMETQQIRPKTGVVDIMSQGYRTRIEVKDCRTYKATLSALKTMREMLGIEEETEETPSNKKTSETEPRVDVTPVKEPEED